LRPFLLEEAYEVYDALERGATPDLAEELGDLWLQIVLHAQHAAEAGVFDLSDVERSIMTKIVRRHPHVFGDGVARTADDVTRAWEDIKADERAAAGTTEPPGRTDMPAAFEGLSRSLPALAYANEMQARAASLGYDWPDLEGVIDKVAEEATELLGADEPAHRAEEYGDLMFVLVNLARKMDIDPEAALRAASRKFARRFAGVERLARERQVQLKALGLDELDERWQEVKREEAAREERAASGGAVA
jgi:MazG family protein